VHCYGTSFGKLLRGFDEADRIVNPGSLINNSANSKVNRANRAPNIQRTCLRAALPSPLNLTGCTPQVSGSQRQQHSFRNRSWKERQFSLNKNQKGKYPRGRP